MYYIYIIYIIYYIYLLNPFLNFVHSESGSTKGLKKYKTPNMADPPYMGRLVAFNVS